MTKFGLSLLGINPKLTANVYPVNLSTALQQSKKLLDPLVFISKW